MSKITFGIIPLLLIVILSVFFFLSPKFLGQKASNDAQALTDLVVKRFTSIGNAVAHATFVVDATIANETYLLVEIITQLRQDEPDITVIHFTDSLNKIIASSDPNSIDKPYNPTILASSIGTVKEKAGIFEGGFNISIGSRKFGAFYFQAKPKLPEIKVAAAPNPIILIVGGVFAFIAFFITLSMGGGLESKLVQEINSRQEEVFLPRIDALKNEQSAAQKTLDDLNKKTSESQTNLKRLQDEYATKKKEYESNPVMQSVEKLRATEADLLKRLEALKGEEGKLNKEVSLLVQKREEIMNALEAEKKEEATLREKLDLIKKKILHLETPG